MVVGRIVLTAIVLAAIACDRAPVSSDRRAALERAWEAYKQSYVHPDGYVLDPDREGGETTSEGQGYGLLRAALMHDEATFLRLFRWTEERLRRPDGLYSWRWTPDRGGQVLDPNTAADADQEIALALLLGA